MAMLNTNVDASWAALIARAKRQEPEALDAIVDQYAGRLFGFFHRMIGAREGVEDLVQEVFVRVVRMIPQYDEKGRFESWLFRIAANLNRDRIRKLQRQPIVSLDETNEAQGQDVVEVRLVSGLSQEHGPQDALAMTESLANLQVCLMKLSTDERTVVLLRHYGQLEYSEISQMMETPIGTALARAHRGLKKLRQMMESGT